ncbi:GrpB family protein [Luedemannella flava]
MISPDDLAQRLERLTVERGEVLDEVTLAAQQAGASAVLLIGSLGRGGGDAFSDLDLICVPAPHFTGVDLGALFGQRVVGEVVAPRNAPVGGAYEGLCLGIAGAVCWLDWYTWPQATAAIPADARALFDTVGLPRSDLTFIPVDQPAQRPGRPSTSARSGHNAAARRRGREVPGPRRPFTPHQQAARHRRASLNRVHELLHAQLAAIDAPELVAAVTGTAALVDLAAAQYASMTEGTSTVNTGGPAAGLAYGTVKVVAHDAGWAHIAADHIARIRAALSAWALAVEHVGSTAVVGLPAKPIVDLAVLLAVHADPEQIIDRLGACGYVFRGDKGDQGGMLFVAETAPRVRVAHVHVLPDGDPQGAYYLAVRDRLRDQPHLAEAYAALKIRLAAEHGDDRASYTAAKDRFLAELLTDLPTATVEEPVVQRVRTWR